MQFLSASHRWLSLLSLLGVAVAAVALGAWWWSSLQYVSTDDARIKADLVTVSSEIPGRLAGLAKGEGDSVARGETLARLNQEDVKLEIRQAKAKLDRSQSRLLEAQREMEIHVEKQKEEVLKAEAAVQAYRYHLQDAVAHEDKAKMDWQRIQSLFARELVSAQELTNAETELRQTAARVSALQENIKEAEATLGLTRLRSRETEIKKALLEARRAEVREAQAALEALQRKLELTTIQSPTGGVIVKKNANAGEFIQAGEPIFTIVDSRRFWVEANIEETEIRFVKPGNPVLLRVDSYPSRDFRGRVVEVGQVTVSEFALFSPQQLTGQFIKSTQRLPVKIAVDNSDGLLKVGMLAVVWIEKDRR